MSSRPLVLGFLALAVVSAVLAYVASRPRDVARPLGIAAPGATTTTRHVDMTGSTANLDVTALDDDALAKRGITRTLLGELELPTGRVVVADPLVSPERPALARGVEPGRYAVSLYRAQERVSLAELRFASGTPARWQMALIPGQDASTLKSDEIFGYPVDAGLGSFMDADAVAALDAREKQEKARLGDKFVSLYDDVLAVLLGKNGDNELLFQPLPDKPANIAIFQSGWGDGFFASYWGLDEAGKPLVLVTDFGVIENGDGRRPEERWSAERLAAMTSEQRGDSAVAYAAMQSGDLSAFEALLKDGRITPDTPVEERQLPFTALAIMDDNAGALDLLVRYGARSVITPEIGLVWKTYPELADVYEKADTQTYPGGMVPKRRSPDLMAVIRRWPADASR